MSFSSFCKREVEEVVDKDKVEEEEEDTVDSSCL